MAPTPGQVVRTTGEWINHPKFGVQFKSAVHDSRSCYGGRNHEISRLGAHQRRRRGVEAMDDSLGRRGRRRILGTCNQSYLPTAGHMSEAL
jgi:hypothetical protein